LSDGAEGLCWHIASIYGILFAFNAGVWIWSIIAFHHYPILLGTALLAYGFGLRHAVDADHSAAIDNMIRKLMQDGKRPVAVGFMFSVGTQRLCSSAQRRSQVRPWPCNSILRS
jgi:nickel/cobalt transporter (NiCoT) family protein